MEASLEFPIHFLKIYTSADAANFERLACEYIFGSLKKWPNAGRQAPPEAGATQERRL
jgi:hypothetical protein